ncbi:MAG: DUF89 family protein [Anaerolineales bacterium]|nr:DUF89 family protein [Anaerolineales bacterium]
MQTYLDCIPCAMQQLLRTARLVTDDEAVHLQVLISVGEGLANIRLSDTPPEMARDLYRRLYEITGNPDPYYQLRRKSTRRALALYPRLKAFVESAEDPLFAAASVAATGNLIDYGVLKGEISIEEEVDVSLSMDTHWDEFPIFRDDLTSAEWILYIGDNAGETVFDRVFIETIDKPVIYVVRGGPAINDALLEDAVDAGLDRVAELLPSGLAAAGVIPHLCSDRLQEKFFSAPLIISKGQGNCEALNETEAPIYFLLKVKCEVMANLIQAPMGELVLRRSLNYKPVQDSARPA